MNISRILLDMDEIITDFVGGACEAWGAPKEEVLKHWPIGKWDIIPPLGKALGIPLSPDDFWSRLNGSEQFWLDLEPLPWAREVVDLAHAITPEVYVVTAPSRCGYSFSAKVKWLKRFFGDSFDRFVLTPHKHLFAGPGVYLVDDNDLNVDRFRDAGGVGVVFPCYHNRLHSCSDDPVAYLRRVLCT